ncbi:hypothetical protein [Halovulum sp. GXIMD14793]
MQNLDRPLRSQSGLFVDGFAIIAFFICGVVLSGLGAYYIDDTLITFTYARNLSEYGDLNWWPGLEPAVDGFTSLLHVVLLAAGMSLGLDIALANSVICFGSYILLMLMFLKFTKGLRFSAQMVGLAAIAFNASYLFWLGGGLDGMLFSMLFLATYTTMEKACSKESSGFGFSASVAITLLTLARPEGILIATSLVIFYWLRSAIGACQPRIFWPTVVLLTIAGQMIWRFYEYGAVVPNTYFAKRSDSLTAELSDGLVYFGDWVWFNGGFVILLTLLAFQQKTTTLLRGLMVVGLVALVIVEGGDPHPMSRFLMPVIALIAIDMARLLDLGSYASRIVTIGIFSVYLGIQLASALTVESGRTNPSDFGSVFSRIADGKWPYQEVRDDLHSEYRARSIAEMDRIAPANIPIVATDVGAMAYFSQHRIIDALGLNDRTIAHLPKPPGEQNQWGTLRLDYLVEQKVPIMLLTFPTLTQQPLGEGLGQRICTYSEWLAVTRITVNADIVISNYRCASRQTESKTWANLLVYKDASSKLSADTIVRNCIPDLVQFCASD